MKKSKSSIASQIQRLQKLVAPMTQILTDKDYLIS